MSLPTKTQYETLFDSVAARAELLKAGLASASLSPTARTFFQQIDAIGNPAIERALIGPADDLDDALASPADFLANQAAQLFGPLFQALQSQVRDDGTYASVDAALTALGAQVSPRIQDMARSGNAFGAYLSPANVWSPTLQAKALDRVLTGTEGALVDDTTDAGNATTADCAVFAADDDVVFLGYNELPAAVGATETLSVCMSTPASADVVLSATYFDGTAWSTLALALDGTTGFTANGVIRFVIPANWSKTCKTVDGSDILSTDLTPRYYIRLQRTANTVVTPPVVSMIRSCGGCLGVFKITGANAGTLYGASSINRTLYDAANLLSLRPLTPIAQNVTLTIGYTNRAGDAAQSQSLGAWTGPALGTNFNPASIAAGVASIQTATIATTATVGLFAIESLPPRTPAA